MSASAGLAAAARVLAAAGPFGGPAVVSAPAGAWGAALLVGLSLGLLGSGGSMLAVPLLHAWVGLPFAEARATSYPIVGGVALAGMFVHARRGTVRPWKALPFVLASLPCTFATARWVAPHLDARVQATAFAVLMAFAAAQMLRRPRAAPAARPRGTVPATGAAVGALTGLLGVGGGFLVVPSLVLGVGLDVRAALGTSLLVVALNCAVALGATWAAGDGVAVHGDLALLFGAVGVVGVLVGARLAGQFSTDMLRRLFAVVVTAVAVWLLGATWC